MAYDEKLANRIRELTSHQLGLSEKKMFGGLAFLINGNMAIAASGQGGLLLRVDPAQTQQFISGTKAQNMIMRGRNMSGWLRVSSENVSEDSELEKWVSVCCEYAKNLSPK